MKQTVTNVKFRLNGGMRDAGNEKLHRELEVSEL